MKYVLRRLGFYALAAWVSITLAFFIPRMMPGDPAERMFARFRGKLTPEALADLKEAFGFADGSMVSQYFSYLGHVLTGDLGISVKYYPATVGSVIGLTVVWGVQHFYSSPRAPIVIPWWLSLGSCVLVLVICLLASLVPYHRIRKVDPMIVLQS